MLRHYPQRSHCSESLIFSFFALKLYVKIKLIYEDCIFHEKSQVYARFSSRHDRAKPTHS